MKTKGGRVVSTRAEPKVFKTVQTSEVMTRIVRRCQYLKGRSGTNCKLRSTFCHSETYILMKLTVNNNVIGTLVLAFDNHESINRSVKAADVTTKYNDKPVSLSTHTWRSIVSLVIASTSFFYFCEKPIESDMTKLFSSLRHQLLVKLYRSGIIKTPPSKMRNKDTWHTLIDFP